MDKKLLLVLLVFVLVLATALSGCIKQTEVKTVDWCPPPEASISTDTSCATDADCAVCPKISSEIKAKGCAVAYSFCFQGKCKCYVGKPCTSDANCTGWPCPTGEGFVIGCAEVPKPHCVCTSPTIGVPYCGNDVCDAGETQTNCCADCGCPEGKGCVDNVCVES